MHMYGSIRCLCQDGVAPGMVEVAYTVNDDYQGCGLGTLLQARLEGFAASRGFRGAVGYLFGDNLAMLKTFGKRGSYSGDILEDGILRVQRLFQTAENAGNA